MSKPTLDDIERIAELQQGLAIWKVHLDAIREQDVNARVMDLQKFDRLVDNIRREKRLESLPFCTVKVNKSGNKEFELISGHHRVRAARVAAQSDPSLLLIYVLVDERELSRDEVVSKQLSHNAIQGNDDPQVLKELYESILDVEQKIMSGVTDQDLEFDLKTIPIDDVKFDLNFEIINLLFLPKNYDKWEEAVALLDGDAHVGVIDMEYWNQFAATVRQVSQRDDVRNLTAIMVRMVEIVRSYYELRDQEQKLAEEADDGEAKPKRKR